MAEEQPLFSVGPLNSPEALERRSIRAMDRHSHSRREFLSGAWQDLKPLYPPSVPDSLQTLLGLLMMNSLCMSHHEHKVHAMVSPRAQPPCLKGSALQLTSTKVTANGKYHKARVCSFSPALQPAHRNRSISGKFKLRLFSYVANSHEALQICTY